MVKVFLTSITRLSDLDATGFDIEPITRDRWASGDFVVCEVVGAPSNIYRVELASGRRTPVLPGQRIVGALGRRAATHECAGDWRAVGDDLRLHQLTGAGLLGKVTANSRWAPRPMELIYQGHATRGGKLNIADFVVDVAGPPFALPAVIIAGTAMSAGKTLTSRAVIVALKGLGYRVVAAKLTGAAGYKDALSYGDAGADHFLDYVDAGLTSTVCAVSEFEAGLERLLARAAAAGGDVFVGEIGASPLEPYNGEAAMRRLAPHMRALALCASDAYAALGFVKAVPWPADFVAGPAANTPAAADLVRRLTGLEALDLADARGQEALRALLRRKLA